MTLEGVEGGETAVCKYCMKKEFSMNLEKAKKNTEYFTFSLLVESKLGIDV